MSNIIYSESFREFLRNSDCKVAQLLYRLSHKSYDTLLLTDKEINYGGDGYITNVCTGEYTYNETDGTREGEDQEDDHDGETYDEINVEWISDYDAVYIEYGERKYRGNYCHRDNCVCIGDDYYYEDDNTITQINGEWYTKDSEDICEIDGDYYLAEDCIYCKRDSCYYLQDDCVYCEDDEEDILRSEAIEIDSKWYHTESDKITKIEDEYYLLDSDEIECIDGEYSLKVIVYED